VDFGFVDKNEKELNLMTFKKLVLRCLNFSHGSKERNKAAEDVGRFQKAAGFIKDDGNT
jgi:hypothetical protein